MNGLAGLVALFDVAYDGVVLCLLVPVDKIVGVLADHLPQHDHRGLDQDLEEIHRVMGINYGSNKMRFLQPVAVNSEVRGMATLKEVTEKAPGQLLLKNEFVVQIKGEDKPALVAEILSMFIVQ